MKNQIKKLLSVCIGVTLLLTMFPVTTASALSTNDYFNTYTTVADIANRSSCTAMQGLAVGSTWLYTVKTKTDNSSAVIQKTNKNTGATTNLTDSSGSATYSFLGHANDMDVATIDGYSQLYIATMTTGSNSLVRMKINGSKATKTGSYTVMLNGAQKSVSAVCIESTTDTDVNFLFKVGTQVYRGSVAKSATSGTINIAPAFKINTSSVKVNGTTINLSSYTHQGMGYHKGKIYVPLWGGGADKQNQSIIAVYDTLNASGTVTSDPYLSFRITSSAYTGFEIEGCDVSSDGKLYFNANRWTSSSGNYDGVFYFNGYKSGNNPNGNVDEISGGVGTVAVRGWAFDKDSVSEALQIHVYIGGESGDSNAEGYAITANAERTDVNTAFGCGDYHGFDAVISTSKRDSQSVYIYAMNVREGTNQCIGSGTVNIINDTNPPTISDITISELSASGYRISCNVYDESGISSVRFPTWTENGGQDDLIWHEGTVSGNTATCYISTAEHNSEYGKYITHIYAYDGYDNSAVEPVNVNVISDALDLGDDFYANISYGEKNLSLDASNVVLYENDGTLSELWRFIRQSNGSYKIVNALNGKCLDVSNASAQADANVQIYDDNGSVAQRWYIYSYSGKYVFKAACAPDCALDVENGSTENGTNIQQWNFTGAPCQLFEINKAESLGDVDLDGKITLSDAITVMKASIDLVTLEGQGLLNADINKDGIINLYDALAIQRITINGN